MAEKILPIAAMERILRKGSPDIRVSDEAKDALREILEEYGIEISRKAVTFSEHAGRKTIKADDVKLAVKHQ